MIRNRTIICVASNWSADRTSKHHVMTELARENTVLWVNYHGTRCPRVTAADARSAGSVLFRVLRGQRVVNDSLVEFTPLVIPGAHEGVLGRLNQSLVIAQIRRALRVLTPHADRPVQIWTFAPDVPFLAGRFDEERFVYYCVDEYAQFDGHDARAIQNAEREQIERADVVLCTSEALRVSKSTLHPNAHLVRHGVDVDHFASALKPGQHLPEDVCGLKGPLVGFFGLIHHWVDIELIADVARRLPHMRFVLLGSVLCDVSPLRALDNVHLLGRKPYADLPAYCAAFDLAIVPFRESELTRNVNPIKLREYLAAGLGVVSTPLPESRVYEPEVTIASDAGAFADACVAAANRATRADRIRRARLVADETWTGVVRNVSSLVTNAKPPARPHVTAAVAVAPSTIDPAPRREGRTKPDELRPAAPNPATAGTSAVLSHRPTDR